MSYFYVDIKEQVKALKPHTFFWKKFDFYKGVVLTWSHVQKGEGVNDFVTTALKP